ncbi:hypothetical protein COK34_06985 [Bacillus thuringiensis]|uniref:TIR domain-containing protein n=1 Tax=Bacillus thuringiensis TaxID=1428 RepID=UPI000BF7FB98|nr:TIR domain-containing protein [Bacillus thuringiensis]PFD66898.1 hypothetical protein CN309_08505 [Bacillus thuringiensis]PFO46533.1 hypothetical protein COJ84_01330 [Bacillus thuringiensis]PFR56353.1 hypothetical protein COK34_06985 [Bacillus thuringiensis]
MTRKFYEEELRQIAKSAKPLLESSSQILKSASVQFSKGKKYDIFLSHSFRDAEVIHGLKIYIESTFGLSVYVDWVDDPELDRSQVTKTTADRLRERMKNCSTLLVAHSEATPDSKWVPWEVGYFDSNNGRIAILPITQKPQESEVFNGQEYLGLYSYAVRGLTAKTNKDMIWIQDNPEKFTTITAWIKGVNPSFRRGA